MPMGAALAGGAISAIGGIFGASKAAKAQKAATAEQRAARLQAREDLSPWMTAGRNALMPVQDLAGVNGPEASAAAMEDFTASPGYQYQFDEGLRAVDAGAASRGMLRSGATIKAEQTLGSNLANQSFDQYYGRLNALSQQGLTAAGATAGQSIATGQGIAQTMASGGVAQANAINGGLQGVGNAFQQAAGNSIYGAGKRNALSPDGASGGGGGWFDGWF